jgi:alpha-1,6-mannosyltransferase
MRVVDISEFFSDFGGGVKTYVHQKLEICSRAGVEPIIIAPGPADRREKRLGGEIIWVKSPTLPFDHRYSIFARSKPVHDLLDELDPDFVEGSSTWLGAWIARNWRGRAPRALFLHQDPVAVYPQSILSPAISEDSVDRLFRGFWSYLRRLARGFDVSIAPGGAFARRLAAMDINNVVSCPLGVDHAMFASADRDENLRRKMLAACGVADPKAPLFIAVSRHHPEKRLPTVIRGFARFVTNRPAGLYIIGDGPMWRSVGLMARKTPGVHAAGPMHDRALVARSLASADYFVHGGAAETYGLVVGEALVAGLPIIAPHLGGAAEFAHPTCAETYRAGDHEALAAAMERIIARDRRDLSVAARAASSRVVTPDDHFARLLETYRSVARPDAVKAAA